MVVLLAINLTGITCKMDQARDPWTFTTIIDAAQWVRTVRRFLDKAIIWSDIVQSMVSILQQNVHWSAVKFPNVAFGGNNVMCAKNWPFVLSHNHGDQKCYLKTADARKGLETDYDFNSGKSSNHSNFIPPIKIKNIFKVPRTASLLTVLCAVKTLQMDGSRHTMWLVMMWLNLFLE